MPVIKYREIKISPISMQGAHDVWKANVIGAPEGWPGHTLRVFRLKPGGYTPKHQHDWEHVNYVVKGRGRLTIAGTVHEIQERDFAFVPPNTEHQFENPFDEEFEFICIVPSEGAY
jgi:quercetin dioxygenase-like cupin family protein